MLVGVEAGLGLSLLPKSTVAGRHVQPYAAFGAEPSMAISIYAWEKARPIADLADRMTAVLTARLQASE